MVAAAHGNEACTVENGRFVCCGNRSAYLLYNLAHQSVQLIIAVSFLAFFILNSCFIEGE